MFVQHSNTDFGKFQLSLSPLFHSYSKCVCKKKSVGVTLATKTELFQIGLQHASRDSKSVKALGTPATCDINDTL